MTHAVETITTFDLEPAQLLAFDGGTRMRVLSGAAWLTEEGRPGDAIVAAGREVALRGGRSVAEALEPTRLQVVEARRGRGGVALRASRRLRRAALGWRRLVARLQLGAAGSPEDPGGSDPAFTAGRSR